VDLWRLTFCYVKGNLKIFFFEKYMASKKKWIKAQCSKVLYISRYWPRSNYYQRQNHYENYENKDRKKKQKNLSHNSYSRLREKRPKNEKKSFFLSFVDLYQVDIEPPFGLVRMFFDMSLTNSRKGCMTMVKVKYDKKR
jgi:hypothetical protein